MQNCPKQKAKLSKPARFITPKRFRDQKLDILDRASLGVMALYSMSDKVLAEEFLDSYMEMNFGDILGSSARQLETLTKFHRGNTLCFLQNTLNIHVRELDPSLARRPASVASLISHRSVFAPSLSSSSFSSFMRGGKQRSSWRSTSNLLTTTEDDVDVISERLSQINVSLEDFPNPEVLTIDPWFDPWSMFILVPTQGEDSD